MNASEWLALRTPAPASLAVRVQSLLDQRAAARGEPAHDTLARAAEQSLSELLVRGDHSRAIAADLLAVDALVTYACEAAGEALDPPALARWSDAFAKRIATSGIVPNAGAGAAGADSAARSEAGS